MLSSTTTRPPLRHKITPNSAKLTTKGTAKTEPNEQRNGAQHGWAGDVVVHHKTACAFYGLPGTGKRKRTTTTKRNANKGTAPHENTPFVF